MPHEIATRRVLYETAGAIGITPQEFTFRGSDGEPLAGRIYLPASNDRSRIVVIVESYPDPGFVKQVGCRFMDMQWSISMAQLVAASGLAVVTYANRQPAPDLAALIDYLGAASRVGFWATSGHAPVAISMLDRAECAVLSNPVTRGVATIAANVPMFVIRSGKDETPGLNESLDRFVAAMLAENRQIAVVNYPDGPHSFELYHDNAATRLILRQALEFLRAQLHTSEG
jgi:dipeptidyl aminopeptidase/acylaminoacyl peptidase